MNTIMTVSSKRMNATGSWENRIRNSRIRSRSSVEEDPNRPHTRPAPFTQGKGIRVGYRRHQAAALVHSTRPQILHPEIQPEGLHRRPQLLSRPRFVRPLHIYISVLLSI